MDYILTAVDMVTLCVISFSCLIVLIKTHHASGVMARSFQLSLLIVSGAVSFKLIDRLNGDFAGYADLLRDFGLAWLFINVVVFHKERFKKL